MKTYDLYGVKCSSLTLAKAKVEELTGVSFEERDSTYHGGVYYLHGEIASENFILKNNIDPFDGDPVEQEFPDYPVLFYINATYRSLELLERLQIDERFSLLRHEIF